MRVAYLSAGTIGAGHAVRGIALQRAVTRSSLPIDIRLFVPDTGLRGLPENHATMIQVVGDDSLLDSDLALKSPLAKALREFSPDLILVDLFWLPFQSLLAQLKIPAWLLLRSCPDWWFSGPSGHQLDRTVYSRLIVIEPDILTHEKDRIEPIVVVNRDESVPPGALARHFSLDAQAPLHVVVHAGRADELDIFARHRRIDQSLIFDLHREKALFPAAAWLSQATSILCAAGYNSYYEAKWLGYFEQTHFLAMPRSIDDQSGRIRSQVHFQMRANGADQLVAALIRGG
jgi:hypothetical protein